MKNRWERLAVVLGAAMLVVCQSGVIQVRAEEAPATEESVLNEETGNMEGVSQKTEDGAEETATEGKEDSVDEGTESADEDASNGENMETKKPEAEEIEDSEADGKEDDLQKEENPDTEDVEKTENTEDTSPDSREIVPATELGWSSEEPGTAYFINPNEKDEAVYVAHVYCNDEYRGMYSVGINGFEKDAKVPLYIYQYFNKVGSYTFTVETMDKSGKIIGSKDSEPYEYIESEKQLHTPENISWNKDGIFSCELPEDEDFEALTIKVDYPNVAMFSPWQLSSEYGTNYKDGYISFNLNAYLLDHYGLKPGKGAKLQVRATSKNTVKCRHSEWVWCAFDDGAADDNTSHGDSSSSSDSSPSDDSDSVTEVVYEEWKPGTPEEAKRYAAYSKEKVDFVAEAGNYTVSVKNAMQGPRCFDSFEAVLGDFSIGRTYNIYPGGRVEYKMDSKARITLSIPKALQAAGREFKMICVTANGLPIVLDNLSSDPETITFETDTYYAFALIYKDAIASK